MINPQSSPNKFGCSDIWLDVFKDKSEIEKWLFEGLFKAFYKARLGKRGTNDEQKFEIRFVENIRLLVMEIMNRSYLPGGGIAFLIRDPVIREIFAAPFRDRIIHHFLYDQVADYWDARLIRDCYSCRVGKGTLDGAQRMKSRMQSARDIYKEPIWVIKLDIQGYFMSLPREGLFRQVEIGLRDQFLSKKAEKIFLAREKYAILHFLWERIIFDDPIKWVTKRGNPIEWRDLPRTKSLFDQPPGFGIVIGNLSSQLLSNVYLNQFDQFVKGTLGYKHYGRYVDDFYVVVPKSQLTKAKADIETFRRFLFGLGLTLHPKKIFIQEARRGVPFLGMVIYPDCIIPGKRIRRNFKEALRLNQMGVLDETSIISYLGMLKHVNGDTATAKIFSETGLEYNF